MLQKGGKAAPCLQLSQRMYGWDCHSVNQLCSLWLHVTSPEQDGSPQIWNTLASFLCIRRKLIPVIHFCIHISYFIYVLKIQSSEQCQSSNLLYQRNICELFLGIFIHSMVWLIVMRSIFIHCWIKCRPLFYVFVKQISDIFVTALNQGLIQFELKADIHIIVYMTQQTLGTFFFSLSFVLALSKTFF